MGQKEIPDHLGKILAAMKAIPPPNPARQAAARQVFLAQAAQLRAQAVSERRPARPIRQNNLVREKGFTMTALTRVIAALVLLSGLGTGTALAADTSVPGQFLYPLDLALEDVQRMLAFSPAAQARLSLQLAIERISELIELARSGQTIGESELTRLQTQLQVVLQDVSQLQQQDMIRLLTKLRDVLRERASQMEQFGFVEGAAILNQFHQQAQNGIDDPAGFQQQYRFGVGWQGGNQVEAPQFEATDEATLEPEDDSVDADTPEPDRDRDRDQDRDRDRDRDQDRERDRDQDCQPGTANCPNPASPTPAGSFGQGGNPNSGSHNGPGYDDSCQDDGSDDGHDDGGGDGSEDGYDDSCQDDGSDDGYDDGEDGD